MSRHATTGRALALFVLACGLPASAQVQSHRDIKYPPLPDFAIPRPERFELPNGMSVFLLEDHELPLIEVTVRVRVGSSYEPAAKTGLGEIFGQVQREGGTRKMTGDQMDDFLEARAASIETGMGSDVGFASMSSLVEDFDAVFDLFYGVLREPAFAEDKVELAKVQANTGIARRNDDVGGIISREFPRLIYGPDSPLSRLTEYATIAAVERQDLVAWHEKYYHPNNMLLGVVGDFDSAAMKKKISARFADWPRGPAADLPRVAYRTSVEPAVYFIEKEDVTQAQVRLGHLGIEMADTDYFPLQVVNEVLGGCFASRLFSTVRSEKGLAYSVFGGVGAAFDRHGVFQLGLSTKSSTMAEAVRALQEELRGIVSRPPTAEEIARAKEAILNSFIFRYDSSSEVLEEQMLYAYYGMPADFLETYRAKIEAVTPADAARVAREHIHPDKVVLLVVGKAADFDQPVSTFGAVKTIDIAIAPPPDRRPAVEKTAASREAGAKVFSRAVDALATGEPEKVEAVRASYTVAIAMGEQSMSMGQEVSYRLPDKLRQEVQTPMGAQLVVLNGDRGAMQAGGQTQAVPQAMVDEGLQDLSRDLLVLTSLDDPAAVEAVAAGQDDVAGQSCDVVVVSYDGTESRLCVDATGKVLKQSYNGKHPFSQAPALVEVVFSDYGDVDGHLVPHKQVLSYDGKQLITVQLESIEINPQPDPAEFEVPN
jgi:predicted Zn-dependent peptidase